LYIYLSKILPLLVLPVGIIIELSVIAFFLLMAGKRRATGMILVCAILVLWVSSMPIVAQTLVGRLERDYPAIRLEAVPAGKCIVLLGGTVQPALPPRVDLNMLEGIDRVRKAAQLYRAGKGQVVVVTGGNQPWSPLAEPEARSIKTLLVEWGVPASAILLEDRSRNTYENAVNSGELLKDLDCVRTSLVTSAAHMKRSVGVFAKQGIDVFPVSADVRVIENPRLTILDFLPDADALNMTSDAIREWIGRGAYRIQGWT